MEYFSPDDGRGASMTVFETREDQVAYATKEAIDRRLARRPSNHSTGQFARSDPVGHVPVSRFQFVEVMPC